VIKNNAIYVVSLNSSKVKGTVKKPVSEVIITEYGILGDAHAGNWHRQVSMLSQERIDQFSLQIAKRINPGEFAENITTCGIDLKKVAILDRFKIASCELEVTQIGKVCHGDKCSVYKEVGKCIMPKEGIFCRVLKCGKVKDNDSIEYLPRPIRFFIITLSDRVSEGKSIDKSGPKIKEMLKAFFENKPWHTEFREIILPDNFELLRNEIEKAKREGIDFIFTTGGTGIGPNDITPDVVGSMVDKTIPGIMECIRIKYGEKNPKALLSRSIAGLIGNSFIYTLPGSIKAVKEYMEEILKILEHSIYMLHGIDVHQENG